MNRVDIMFMLLGYIMEFYSPNLNGHVSLAISGFSLDLFLASSAWHAILGRSAVCKLLVRGTAAGQPNC